MDVGVFVLVEVRKAIDDGAWLLGGSGIVEPGDLSSVDPLRKNREVASDVGDIKDGPDIRGGGTGVGEVVALRLPYRR